LAYERCVPTSIPNSARAKISRVSRSDDAAPGLPSNYWLGLPALVSCFEETVGPPRPA
jgi:hypothetical protein